MKITKNKKADLGEATGMTLGQIISWIILFALVFFVFFWYSGLGTKIIKIGKSFLK